MTQRTSLVISLLCATILLTVAVPASADDGNGNDSDPACIPLGGGLDLNPYLCYDPHDEDCIVYILSPGPGGYTKYCYGVIPS